VPLVQYSERFSGQAFMPTSYAAGRPNTMLYASTI
jgi:hypothetical protein